VPAGRVLTRKPEAAAADTPRAQQWLRCLDGCVHGDAPSLEGWMAAVTHSITSIGRPCVFPVRLSAMSRLVLFECDTNKASALIVARTKVNTPGSHAHAGPEDKGFIPCEIHVARQRRQGQGSIGLTSNFQRWTQMKQANFNTG